MTYIHKFDMTSYFLQRSFRVHTRDKATKGHGSAHGGGSFFHRRLSSKSPSRNMTTNLTTEIQIDSSSLTGSTATASSAPSSTPAGTDQEGAPVSAEASEDIINNGTKVTRSQSAKYSGDTTKSTSVPSQAVRRTRTVSSSSFTSSVEEDQAGELAEEAGSSEDPGLLRRTRKKVVNAFK